MPLNYNTLSYADYAAARLAVTEMFEGNKGAPYLDTAKSPKVTIGIGINLMLDSNLVEVLRYWNFDVKISSSGVVSGTDKVLFNSLKTELAKSTSNVTSSINNEGVGEQGEVNNLANLDSIMAAYATTFLNPQTTFTLTTPTGTVDKAKGQILFTRVSGDPTVQPGKYEAEVNDFAINNGLTIPMSYEVTVTPHFIQLRLFSSTSSKNIPTCKRRISLGHQIHSVLLH
jgi:hypothetical protein